MITYCTYSKGSYFSLFDDMCLSKLVRNCRKYELNNDFFTFVCLNMDISVTIHVFELKFSVCDLYIPLKDRQR